jgi:hypothetical protein
MDIHPIGIAVVGGKAAQHMYPVAAQVRVSNDAICNLHCIVVEQRVRYAVGRLVLMQSIPAAQDAMTILLLRRSGNRRCFQPKHLRNF